MTTRFIPADAADGKYDYLVDFLRNNLRRARQEGLAQERLGDLEALLKAVAMEIEVAAAAAPGSVAADSPPKPSTDLDEIVRRLSMSVAS